MPLKKALNRTVVSIHKDQFAIRFPGRYSPARAIRAAGFDRAQTGVSARPATFGGGLLGTCYVRRYLTPSPRSRRRRNSQSGIRLASLFQNAEPWLGWRRWHNSWATT